MQKEAYVQPTLVKHELLRDITASASGVSGGGGGGGKGGGRGRGRR